MVEKLVFVSSHKVVRDALVEADIPFALVFPERGLKGEYLKRFRARGSDSNFVKLLDDNWDNFIDELENQAGCTPIRLKAGQFLKDVL